MSIYADEGTVAHEVARMALVEGCDAQAYIGRVIECRRHDHHALAPSAAERWISCPGSTALEVRAAADERAAGEQEPEVISGTVSEDMAEHVQTYVSKILEYSVDAELVLIEHRVHLHDVTGVVGHGGTADCVILAPGISGLELQIHDLKFGRGVPVEAERNAQLQLYALGALRDVRLLGYAPSSARLVIHQPRIGALREWVVDVDALERFGAEAKDAATLSMRLLDRDVDELARANALRPSTAACRFCAARPICPALADLAQREALAGMEAAEAPSDINELARKYELIPMLESFCKAVAAKFEAALLRGERHPKYKIIRGRRPPRKWIDEDAVLKAAKALKIQAAIQEKIVLSPAQVEAKVRALNPSVWAQLEQFVFQGEGKLTVAPVSDPAPAVDPTAVALAGMPSPRSVNLEL